MALTRCSACGEDNRPGRRFCAQCGAPLELRCSACQAVNLPGERFCGECGSPLLGDAVPPALGLGGTGGAAPATPVSERRLVSVLFADLVGFTTFSEHRDPEEVRDLLSHYFDRCRSLIERYGGTVEKFIGDAVMAVWGTPVAREDDAERAVRAALGLTQAVRTLAEEVEMPELRVRAGVLTGNAAVEIGAEGEGMVLGDTVNTASRLQSVAAPGTVLVDDVTRRASEAAIAYEDGGTHQVKGREQPVHAWTALRVVAGAGGARRSAGLEAPLVGRARELGLIIDTFEATSEEGGARLVTVTGEAGSGKSRLLWEFFKYTDGIERYVRWHQGRCLSYGEGVAYWALAEMVRTRAGILEEEEAAMARRKLRDAVEEHVPDERERRLVEPRLAHLLGLEQRTAADRADLFSGWRLFFERIADTEPVVLAFEDLQWADSGLLDFIDYLLEWSAEHPIFILALGRPELLRARPEWSSMIALAPLDDDSMTELLGGLVPGLPDELVARIRRRAEGVPLYAVETVRMLLDRGLLVQEGARYVVTGDVSDMAIPETLQALVASRMDNLSGAERSLLQDAAVIGQSFTPAMLAAVSERAPAEIARVLDSLVNKQVLGYVDDPRSPERGQYVFLQALLHSVALSTLSRRDRKARHLAVARHLRGTWGEEGGEIAEVLASHYLDAVEADPEAADVPEIRAAACQTLEEAGRRAMSLAALPEARRLFEQATGLAGDPGVRGRLLRESGKAAQQHGDLMEGLKMLDEATDLLNQAGLGSEAAHVAGLAGAAAGEMGLHDEARRRVAAAYEAAKDGDDEVAIADLASQLSRIAFMAGDRDEALRLADQALTIADGQRLGEILVECLVTKANSLAELGRPAESTALMTYALKTAVEQDLGAVAGRAYYNLADNVMAEGRFEEARGLLGKGLELARRRGDHQLERSLNAQGLIVMVALGEWDEALTLAETLTARGDDVWSAQVIVSVPVIHSSRGDVGPLEAITGTAATSSWSIIAKAATVVQAMAHRDAGRPGDGLAEAAEAIHQGLRVSESSMPVMFAETVDCAFAAGELAVVRDLLADVDDLTPAQLLPLLQAEATRARARLAEADGELERAAQHFRRAIDMFRALSTPFYVARTKAEFAELLSRTPGNEDEMAKLRSEALVVFERLRADRWLVRARALSPPVAA